MLDGLRQVGVRTDWREDWDADLVAASSYGAAHRTLAEIGRSGPRHREAWLTLLRGEPAGAPIRAAAGPARTALALAATERLAWYYRTLTSEELGLLSSLEWAARTGWGEPRAAEPWQSYNWLSRAALELLTRGDLELDAASFAHLAALLSVIAVATYRPPYASITHWLPAKALLRQLGAYATAHGLPATARPLLDALAKHLVARGMGDPKLVPAIEEMLGARESGVPSTGEAWADAIRADLRAVPEAERFAWSALLKHAEALTAAAPSAKWLATARSLLGGVGRDAFAGRFTGWCERLRLDPEVPIGDTNGNLLRGLLWCAAALDEPALVPAMTLAVEACLRKIAQIGLRSRKVGNAGLHALATVSGEAGVAELARLSLKIKHPQANADIEKVLATVVERRGVTRAELDELTVPDHGLDAAGRLAQSFGGATATIALDDAGGVSVSWTGADGKPVRAAPAAVKAAHAAEVKAFAAAAKAIEATVAAQRARLERLMRDEREWPADLWQRRYLDHPIVGRLARRLIWRFDLAGDIRTGCWFEGRLVDRHGHPLPLDSATRVRLWHPLDGTPDEVLQWRLCLEERELVQPFKQAHREVYAVTDAERATGTYSHRFAGHILRQHQLRALAEERGWRYRLQIAWADTANYPTLALPEHDLIVEFAVDPVENDEVAHSMAYLYLASDAVRCYHRDRYTPRPVASLPARLFSEVMRDVDLFVGVCSIGADPEWPNRTAAPHGDYWRAFAFGELSESARGRGETLARLLPRLKLRDRCRLEGRFLVVHGDLHSYKIHLGSGNVLMSPDDRYLCIVPGAVPAGGAPRQVFLPFEGDRTLSLILSKAALLAADSSIADASIRRQLQTPH